MSEETQVTEMPSGIDFDLELMDLNNKPIPKDASQEEGMKIGEACCTALMASFADDKADGVQKLKRFNLARKIQGGVDAESFPTLRLNSKQKKMILDIAETVYSTLIYARIYEALEESTEEDEEE